MTKHHHVISDHIQAKKFMLAGKAKLTVVSLKTADRITYKIKKARDGNVFFVSVFSDAQAEHGYTYAGMIKGDHLSQTTKSKIPATAKSWIAFNFLWGHLNGHNRDGVAKMPPQTEVWHEGCCGRCGRPLTDPVSIQRGIGPECVKIMEFVDTTQGRLI